MSVSASTAALVTLLALGAGAQAAECPRTDTLGTARTLVVDPATTPRVGTKSFPETLPLEDHEVVLTFDDGPAATTTKVLAALADQCVRATFFLVGRPASEHAALVRRIAAAGHTVAHHTYTHAKLAHMPYDKAVEEIDKGIAADEIALYGASSQTPRVPFFRFPWFESTPELLDYLQARKIAAFGADLWASDWKPMTPDEQLKLITERLAQARRGIILFHDPRAQTAAMMPAFLRYLRDHDYRVVHVVPPRPEEPAVASHGLARP